MVVVSSVRLFDMKANNSQKKYSKLEVDAYQAGINWAKSSKKILKSICESDDCDN